jgi:hypothetical protein
MGGEYRVILGFWQIIGSVLMNIDIFIVHNTLVFY